jgi:hypothetical protein
MLNSQAIDPSAIDAARHAVEKAVYVAERTGDDRFSEVLRISFSDRLGEREEGPTVICEAFRVTEPGELVRVYVYLSDVGSTVILDALAVALQPFLEARTDIVLKKLAEGFKICRRDLG